MKKTAAFLLLMSFYASTLVAQPVVTISNISHCCNATGVQIEVPILVQNFTGIGAFELYISNPNQGSGLNFSSLTNLHPQLSAGTIVSNAVNTVILISWFSMTPVTIPNDTLLNLVFTYNCDAPTISNLNFTTHPTFGNNSFLADGLGDPISGVVYNNGSVTKLSLGSMSPSAITPTAAVCAGDSQTYQVPLVSNATLYTWDAPNNSYLQVTSGQGTNQATFAFPDSLSLPSYVIRCIASDGCANQTGAMQAIPINPLPSGTGVITGPHNVCQNISYTFSVSTGALGIKNATSYTWTFPAGAVVTPPGNTSTVSVVFTSPVTNFAVQVFGTNSCGDQYNTPTNSSFPLTVYPLPVAEAGPQINTTYNGQVNLNGSASNGFPPYSYAWTPTNMIQGSPNIQNPLTVQLTADQIYTLIVTDANNCPSLSDQVLVHIANSPLAIASISATPSTICNGQSSQLSVTATGGTLFFNYAWSPAGSLINANTQTPTASPSITTVYTVTVTDYIATPPQSITGTVTVYVNPLPVPVITGPASMCRNTTNNVYTTSTGMSNYIWNVPPQATVTAGGTTTDNSVTVTWDVNGTWNIGVTYTDANGCTGSGTYSVTVHPLPTASITGNPAGICLNSTTPTLTGSGSGGSGVFTDYAWSYSGTGSVSFSSQSAATTTITGNSVGTGIITLVVTDNLTCTSSVSIPFEVWDNPTTSLTGTTPGICLNSTFTGVSGNPGGGNPPYTSAWSQTGLTGVTFSAPTQPLTDITFGSVGSGIITYTVTDNHSCTTSSSIPVTVNPLPIPSITGPTPVCNTITNAVYTTQNNMTNYLWTISAGGTVVSGGTTADNTVTVAWSGSGAQLVSVNYTNSNGCTAAAPATFPVTVTPLPTANITYAGNPFCKTLSTPQPVTLTGTNAYTGGIYSVAPAGLTINPATGAVTPSSSGAGIYTVTYTVPASGGCAVVTAQTSVVITSLPTASITYSGTPFCNTVATAQAVTLTGTAAYTGGTYTSNPLSLTLDAGTGDIIPSSSTPGTYTVTYTVPASAGCATVTANTSIVITPLPTATINYAGSPFCKTLTSAQAVTLTGTNAYTGGSYSAAPSGLSLNTTTGAVTPSTSTAGTYTVTYTIAAAGGCNAVTTTTQVIITPLPTASINYPGSPFCNTLTTAQSVTLTGTNAYTGGTFTAIPGGLTLDPGTGEIIPSTSTPGTYTVTYTIAASQGCATVTANASVTITPLPTASIFYAGTPFCKTLTSPEPVTLTGTNSYTGGIYSSLPAGLSLNSTTGAITPSSSTAGTYTITYTLAAAGGCAVVTANTTVVITALPTASITYAGSPFCNTLNTAQAVSLTGTAAYTGGTYSSNPSGLDLNPANGGIIPSSSTPGTYTITYTVPATAGCASVTANTTIVITPLPTATINYSGSPFCKTLTSPQAVSLTGTDGYTGGTYSAAPAGLSINPATGAIVPSTSTAGSYTVTYTLAAAGGCAVVSATTNVIITPLPTATINYAGSPYCNTLTTAQTVTLTGTNAYTGGTFTAIPSGLSLDAGTGAVTPSSSTPNTYAVTYTIAAAQGCAVVTTNATVIITPLPTASISYSGTPFCTTVTTPQSVTLTGTNAYTGGIFSASPGGLSFNSTTGAITPSTSSAGNYTITYTIAAAGGCAVVTANTTITITPLPTAVINYAGSPFCNTLSNAQLVTLTGTNAYTGGSYSAAPSGLTLDPSTGSVVPGTSTPGSYTVTYTIAAAGGCAVVTATAPVIVTPLPTAGITYLGTPFCNTLTTGQAVTLTGTNTYTGGVYTSIPAGLTLNSSNGAVTPSSSGPGTYTITYTLAATGGCPVVTATTSVIVTPLPTANISYPGSPYCITETAVQSVTLTGTNAYLGGVFSVAPSGLTISPGTGAVTPNTSTAGTYTVTYTIAAAGGCASVTANATVVITPQQDASFTYGGATFCQTGIDPTPTITGSPAGVFTFSPAGLVINSSTGVIDVSASTLNTYSVTYTTPGFCPNSSTVNVTITLAPSASFSYTGTPYCSNLTDPFPTFTGGSTAGNFTAVPAGLVFVNSNTGEVDLSASTPGNYSVTNSIVASGGCAAVSATSPITVTLAPSATISYAEPFCNSLTNPQPVTITGIGSYLGGAYSSTAGLSINSSTGAIIPSTSTPGNYTVTYTIPASAGCSSVTTTTNITITPLPTASITYQGSPYCSTVVTPQAVTLSGTNAYTGGVYSSLPSGLSLNPSTGEVTPSASTAGTYTVNYTIAAAGGCAIVTATAPVIITALPVASISYSGTPFCNTLTIPQAVTLTGANAFTGGVYSSSPAGLSLDAGTGDITPASSTPGAYTVTYTVAAASGCNAVITTTNIVITELPTAAINYSGSPFCNTVVTPQAVTLTGTAAYTNGVYSSLPSGLTLNATSGEIIPSTSTPGTYTITYTIAAAAGCAAVTATATAIITPLPTASITYAGTPFCNTLTLAQPVTLTGTNAYTGGTFSANPSGLNLNASTGAIIPSLSTPGTYTVTYTVAAAGGCAVVTATTGVTITPLPTATISYAGTPFCNTLSSPQPVTLTGTNAYLNGVYSAPVGLSINTTTGSITPSTSTPGTYTVTYTIAAAGGCSVVTATTSVTVTPLPTASIVYSGSPYCNTLTTLQAVTLTGTNAYTGGTYSALPTGLSLNTLTGAIIPSTSTPGNYTVTYTIAAAGGCSVITATTGVTITPLPTATISYSGTPFCNTITTAQAVTLSGTNAYTGGTYTALPSGLSINSSTGAIIPSSSTPGTYTVSYTINAAAGCAVVTATTNVIITPLPTASISYAGNPFCNTLTAAQAVTLSGTNAYLGGTYSAAPAGLAINSVTGSITPSTSTPGNYTVTYTIAAAGGCSVVTATTPVTITPLPTAAISYAGTPFCNTITTPQPVTLTGTNAYTGGIYSSSPSGLILNTSTGEVTPGSSTPGTYTITYTIAAAAGCNVVTATTSIIITPLPTAAISYAGSPFCTTVTTPQPVTLTGTNAYTGGVYSAAPAGLIINPATGAITPSTSSPGTYTVTYTIAAAGGCAVVTATTSVIITPLPTATIGYSGNPFCNTLSAPQPVTLTGTNAYLGGTYSSLPTGLTLNPGTGEVTPNTSTPGSYTVTYSIAAAGGCALVSATAPVTITPLPTAAINYAGTPFCTTLTTSQAVTLNGTNAYTGGIYSATPAGLTLNASTGGIIPSTSTPGNYTITYTLAASGGCALVTATTNITITPLPTASINYPSSPYCIAEVNSQSVVLTGTNAYTGGTYSSTPAGLTLNTSTGAIVPNTSIAGTYTVTYTIAAANGCSMVTATAPVTITPLQDASFTYGGATFCQTGIDPTPTITGSPSGTFTYSPAGLVINTSTGTIDVSASTLGTYSVTYTTPGFCPNTSTVNITITLAPSATFSYTGTPYCSNLSDPIPTFTGGSTAGVFTAVPAGLVFVNTNTGQVDLTSSTPGTYNVTNTIVASGGCAAAIASSPITITQAPSVTISYAEPFCTSLTTAQSVNMTGVGAYTGGVFTSLPAGLDLNSSNGGIIPSTSLPGTYTIDYTVAAAAGCASVVGSTAVTITPLPTASITYAGTPFCNTLLSPQPVTLTGTNAYTGGVYSALPAGLSLNSTNGEITPSTSLPGTYSITYTIAAAGGCAVVTAQTSIIITPLPTASINYAGTPFCTTVTAPQDVTLTGTNAYTGGVYSSSPGGLSLNPGNGQITPSTSTPGTYTVTYTIAAAGGCAVVTALTSVIITPLPTATISYSGTPFCNTLTTPQSVTLSGTNAYTGGTYSALPTGLTLDPSTGDIIPGTSTPGTYTVSYVIGAAGGCAVVTATTNVVITPLPTATISYTGTPFCNTLTPPQAVTLNGTNAYTGGTYSALPAGLTVNAGSGAITPSSSTPGDYTITYTIAAAGGCAIVTATTPVTITPLPTASISYSGSPYCNTESQGQPVTLTGTFAYTGGTYSAVPSGLSIDPITGDIIPASSTPDSYTVTYTIAAAGGCAAVSTSAPVVITPLPTAAITYAGTPFCNTLTTGQSVTLTGTNAYTGGTYSSSPAGLDINSTSGDITPSTSLPGTYTVTYTIAAAGGCAVVTATTSIIITPLPTASITYPGSPFCNTVITNQAITLTGTYAYTGGTYTAVPSGLTLNPVTGDVTPSLSTPGTYTVSYTILAAGGCNSVVATTGVTITPLPTANINYAGTPFCSTLSTPQPVTLNGTNAYTGGSYSATPVGLTLNATTGDITPSSSTPGTYTVTYTIPAAAGCAVVTAVTTITITPLPTVSITYSGSPYCNTITTPQSVSINGTNAYTGGTYTSAPAGLVINPATGAVTPSTSTAGTYTVTYTIAAAGGCAAVTATTQVTITPLPTASISYAGTPFCSTLATPQAVTLTGTNAYTGGVYSSAPVGLTLNSGTGAITPSTSTPGSYTVTYTIAAAGGCAVVTTTTPVVITPLPTASISYAGTPFCKTLTTPQSVTLTGTNAYTGGSYTAVPSGLTLNLSTGAITPSTSTAGTYTVTYTLAPAGGCAAVTTTTTVVITPLPTANISYAGTPFCNTLTSPQAVTLTGTNAYTGGTYSVSPAGLTINVTTGAITPSTSTPNTYTVTYTVAAAGGCASVTATTSVIITPLPTASISYTGTPFCKTLTTPQSVTLTGTNAYTGGSYTAVPSGLTLNLSTGAITPSASTAGTYTVTYTIAAAGGCAAVTATTTVVITPLPTANISYAGSPFCMTVTTGQPVTLTGTGGYTGGLYSAAPTGLSINTSTGAVTPSTSTAGSYTVTYTIAAAAGCAAVTATAPVVITPLPTASISYAGTPFCKTVTTAQPVTLTGTNAYTGGTYTFTPGGLSLNASTGAITPSTSTAGTYTVTYTIAAAGGCAAVTATTSVTITALPTAAVSYTGTPFCSTLSTVQAVTLTGTGGYTGGIYSSSPAGLTLNTTTGGITPNTSTPGTYTITYTIAAAGGCAVVTATTDITITALPTASISYSGSPFCKTVTTSEPVTLTGTNAYTGGNYSVSPSGLNLNSSTGALIPSNSSAGTFTVTYTIAPAGGCAAVTATTSVTIIAAPTANAGPDTTVCLDNTLVIDLSAATNYSSLSWSTSGDGNFSDNTILHPTYTPGPNDLATGTLTLTLLVNGNSPCGSISDDFVLTISEQTGAFAGPDTAICAGQTYEILEATTTNANSFTWTTSGTGSFTDPYSLNPTYHPSPADAAGGTVTLCIHAVNTELYCGDSTDCMVLTIKPLPIANAGHDTTICFGDLIQLNATGGDTYLWSPAAGLSVDNIPNPIASPTVTTTYTVSVTLNGCSKTDNMVLTVRPLPIADAGINADICQGDSTRLAATGGYTYLWSTGATTPATWVSPQLTTLYTVTVFDDLGCHASDSVRVVVHPLPTVYINPPSASICRDSTVNLTASGAVLYHWSPSSGLSSNNGPMVTAFPKQTTTYIITGVTQWGCESQKSVTIRVYPTPEVSLKDSAYICLGNPYYLNAGYNDSASYQWQDGSTSQFYLVSEPGMYWVTVKNAGCAVSDTVQIDICTSIWVPNSFTPDGNNLNDIFLVKSSTPEDMKEFHLYIYNRWGEVIFHSQDIYEGWDGTFNRSDCPEGVYIYMVTWEGQGSLAKDREGMKKGTIMLLR